MGQPSLPPGYRFSPTDEELLVHYLVPKATARTVPQGTIAEVDIYKFEPWDLPGQSSLPSKDREWYFFSSQDKKYSHAARINRTTKKGYWKATGKDRKVYSGSCLVGSKKTLIYYGGRAPNGIRTNWVMHEYRLDEKSEKKKTGVSVAVLCRIRQKPGAGPRNGELYGAPIWNEDGETGEGVNSQNVDVGPDTGCTDVVESEDGGNVFDLQNQVEVWKVPGQMDLSKVASDHIGNEDISARKIAGSPKVASDCIGVGDVYAIGVGDLYARKGTNESEPHRNDVFQSSDTCFDTASNFCDYNGDTFPCPHEYMQNAGTLFDFDIFPPLPTLSDVDGQDFALPAFDDESEILGELWDQVGDGQGEVSGTGATENVMLHAACNVLLGGEPHFIGGNFIELDDMTDPLDGFAPRSPLHSSGFGWPEEQQPWLAAHNRVATCKIVQDSVHSQGLAARRARLQIPHVERETQGGWCFAASSHLAPRGSGFNPCDTHHVESSSRSFLSKHVATYAVSKCQVVPAQLCYASLTDVQDGIMTASDTISSSTAVIIGDESNVDTDALEYITTIQKDSSSSSGSDSETNVDTDALENITTIQKDSSSSSGSHTVTNKAEGRSPDVEDALLKTENATDRSSLNGYSRWKKPLRGLVNKAKWSALGTRLRQLESGVRAKFNDKLSALGKPAARFVPTEGNMVNPYDSLRKIIVATLCHLAAAVLIFFCLFWGVRILTNHAFSVAV